MNRGQVKLSITRILEPSMGREVAGCVSPAYIPKPGVSLSAQSWTAGKAKAQTCLTGRPFQLHFNPFHSSFIKGFSWNEPGPKIYLWRREMKSW